MKTAFLLIFLIASFVSPATAAGPSPEEMAKMMADWQKMMQPSDHHKKLEYFVGKWKAKFKVYWAGPDAPAMETEGTAEAKWVLNKRYLQSSYKGTMLMPDPKTGKLTKIPYEGLGMTGYDNVRNLYTGTWADSMGTQMVSFKGTLPPGSKTFRMYGEMDEPMMKMYGRLVKYTWEIKGKDAYVFTIYDLAAGDDYKVIEIAYTRVGKQSSKKTKDDKASN